jgi:probable HAF family extracellular repeat protein
MRKPKSGLRVYSLVIALLVFLRPPLLAGSFQGLGDLPGGIFSSYASGVSADGKVVVGTSQSSNGLEAFRWTATNGMVGLGDLAGGSFSSSAAGVSADGTVVVGSGASSSGTEAFRWTQATGMVGLGDLPGGPFNSHAYAVSGNGQTVVGDSTSALCPFYGEAFRWTATNGMVGLGDFPGGSADSHANAVSADGSVIVGDSSSSNNTVAGVTEAFRWTEGTGMVPLGDFPGGGFSSIAYGVSADGSVVVGRGHSGVEDPFRWTTATGLVHLGFLPCDTWSTAFASSADGSIIVGDPNQGTGDCAFIWDAQDGMRSLHYVLTNDYGLSVTGWQLSHASAITPDGKIIVGYGTNPSGKTEAWLADLTPPLLKVYRAGNNAVLSWPTNGSGFRLQSATNLTPPSVWADSTNPPAVVGAEFTITNSASNNSQFYRLKK